MVVLGEVDNFEMRIGGTSNGRGEQLHLSRPLRCA